MADRSHPPEPELIEIARLVRDEALQPRLTPPPPETSEAAMTSCGLLDDDDLTKANPSEDSRPSKGTGDA